jgi:hypothetical protein
LARHSTPTLTIGRYSHTRSHDLAAALSALPSTTSTQEPHPTPESATPTVTSPSDDFGSGGHSVGQYSGKMGQQTTDRGESQGGTRHWIAMRTGRARLMLTRWHQTT